LPISKRSWMPPARMTDILKLTIFTTDMGSQNILNEISARYFNKDRPPARTLVGVPTLAHPEC
jgi:2-iminobutanoate/2-iminopropanoate deaminase